MSIRLKRVYDSPAADDGYRILVDRVWPRGLRKEQAKIDRWLKDIAPSHELRRWFNHEPAKWEEFKARYFTELRAQPELVQQLADLAGGGDLTLVFSAKDRDHNNAVALKEYLQDKFTL